MRLTRFAVGAGTVLFVALSADGQDDPDATAPAKETSQFGISYMQGVRSQNIGWSGVDGGWYCIISDGNADLHVNVRLTAPRPVEFPNRQLITGISVISEGHSVVIDVTNPYDVHTNGCPSGISPCLADGGLRPVVDGQEVDGLLRFSRNEIVAEGIVISASNLPVECQQSGRDRILARMQDEMLQGRPHSEIAESLEDWILRLGNMVDPDWCTQYVAHHDLADEQSNHAVFKIVTLAVTVRLNVGTNYQGDGELDWDGRVLPDLEFWQMDVGLQGLSLQSESLTGILSQMARPVLDTDGRPLLDSDGHPVIEGYGAFHGTVEDYRVSGSLGKEFPLLANNAGGK